MSSIPGLNLITPTSVSGTGVSLSGAKVIFTGSYTISINGIFDSTYDNYLIVVRALANIDTDFVFRMRLSGSDDSGNNYSFENLNSLSTGSNASLESSQTKATVVGMNGSNPNGAILYLYAPALARATAGRSVGIYGNNNAYIQDRAHKHTLTTAYDGITFFAGGGPTYNFTGALTIYGLSQ